MNHELHGVASVGARASILDVRQVVVSATLQRVTDAPLHAEVEHTFDWRLEDSTLLCQAGCAVRITERDSGDAVFDADVVYGCGFAMSDLEGLDEAAYDEFARVNATLCLYPYIREAVQSLTSRAGLPPFVLGTFRVPVAVATPESVPAPEGLANPESVKASASVKKAPSKRRAPAKKSAARSSGTKRGNARP